MGTFADFLNDVEEEKPQSKNVPAPIRNNNPGALMPGGKLAQYKTPEEGLAAIDKNLASYGKKGVSTLADVISKWAPPSENDTNSYIAHVAKVTGLDPNQKIDLSNPLIRHQISAGIVQHENGTKAIYQSSGKTQIAPAMVAEPAKSDFSNFLEDVSEPTKQPEVAPAPIVQKAQPKKQQQEKSLLQRAFEERQKARDVLTGVGEAGLAAASGMVMPLVAGAKGIVQSIPQAIESGQAPAPIAEKIASKFLQEHPGYQPSTSQGKAYIESLQKAFEASKLPPVLPEVLGQVPSAKPVTGEINEAFQAAKQLKKEPVTLPVAQNLAKQNAGAAQTVNKSVLDQAIAGATPELAAELKTVNASDLNSNALARHLEADSLPIPVRLTKGQALQDPNIISMERNERGIKEQYVEHFNQQNKDLMANAQAIKERTAPNVFTTDYVDDAGNAIGFVNDIKKNNVDATRTAYKDLEALGGGKFPIDAQSFGKNALSALSKGEESEFLPEVFKRRIDEYASGKKEMNFDNFENLRTQIAKASRATDDGNVRHALSVVRQELEDIPMPGATAELKTAADNARSLAKYDFELEKTNDLYNKVVNGKADTKDFIQNFVVRSKNSDFQNSLELLKDNPQAIEHLRSGTLDYLTREATDASGNFSTAKFNKAINKMDVDGKLDALFGGDSQMLRNLVKTGQYVESRPRGAFVNESNTFVAGAKALAASGLEKALNATTANIVPIGTMGREALQSRAIRQQTKESLKPGAGVKLSEIGKP